MEQIWDFLRSVSVHFGSPSQNVLKLILKSPIFVPFGANLTQFVTNLDIPSGKGRSYLAERKHSGVVIVEHFYPRQINARNYQLIEQF